MLIKGDFTHDGGQTIDNSHHIASCISSLYDSQELSDIEIQLGAKIYHAHKLVLCCHSDVFKVMLTSPQWSDSTKHNIILQEEQECQDVFEKFLRYLYSGVVHLTHESVQPMLMLADKYNVTDLAKVCKEYMIDHMVSTIEHNRAVSWYQYALFCGHPALAEACAQFITNNFEKVIVTKDYVNFEKEIVLMFLSSCDLVIQDEYMLYKGAVLWLVSQIDKIETNQSDCVSQFQFQKKFKSAQSEDMLCDSDQSENVIELSRLVLDCVRFPMMSPSQLCLLQQDKFLCNCSKEVRQIFIEGIMCAMNYHSSIREDQEQFTPECGCSTKQQVIYHPRNYTNEVWSTTLNINNFTALPEHSMQSLIFTCPVSGSEADENHVWEWELDIYPKGIQFEKCIMIGLWRNMEVSGATYENVRMMLRSKVQEKRKVNVVVMVTGVQDGEEYTERVVQYPCYFDETRRTCVLNDVVPYHMLNRYGSNLLCGDSNDCFRISIVIKPL